MWWIPYYVVLPENACSSSKEFFIESKICDGVSYDVYVTVGYGISHHLASKTINIGMTASVSYAGLLGCGNTLNASCSITYEGDPPVKCSGMTCIDEDTPINHCDTSGSLVRLTIKPLSFIEL